MKKAKYFRTSDGQEFYKEDTARNHAKTLSNREVTLPGEEITETDIEDVAPKVETLEVEAPEVETAEVEMLEVETPVAVTNKEPKTNTRK